MDNITLFAVFSKAFPKFLSAVLDSNNLFAVLTKRAYFFQAYLLLTFLCKELLNF
jgi:hypothetical protein